MPPGRNQGSRSVAPALSCRVSGVGAAAGRRDLRQSAERSRREDDHVVHAPARASAVGRVADGLHGPAGRGDLLQLVVGEEPDEPAVGRPEGTDRLIRSGQGLDAEPVHAADPEQPFSVRAARREGERRAVGRKCKGSVLRLEVHLWRKLDRRAQEGCRGRTMKEPGRGKAGRADEKGRRHRDPGSAASRGGRDGSGDARLRAALRDPLQLRLQVRRVLPAVLRVLREAPSSRPARAPAASSAPSPRSAPAPPS